MKVAALAFSISIVVSLLSAGCQIPDSSDEARIIRPPPAPMIMQIVAHEDDDFLFMNPDLQNSLNNNFRIVTVYLTSGEAGGDGPCSAAGDYEAGRSERATNRQRAVKAAYAEMAGLSAPYDNNAYWQRELFVPDPEATWPHTAERYTLLGSKSVQLIFMNMRENGDTEGYPDPTALYEDLNATVVTNTIVPSCGGFGTCTHSPSCPDVPWQNYTRAQVLTVLEDLLTLYQPIVIRTLDPRAYEKTRPSGGYFVSFDNLDHRAAAHFTDEAVASYHGPNATGRFTLQHYKGYSFIDYPYVLGDNDYNYKQASGFAYQGTAPTSPNYSSETQADPEYADSTYQPYYRSFQERYPGSTRWLERSSSGTLVAVLVEDRQVKLWYENSIGGTWTGPVNLGGDGPISPHLTLLKLPDGRLQIFALRLPLSTDYDFPPQSPNVDIVTSVQVGSSMSFGPWQSLGAPDTSKFVSAPTAAVDGLGRIFVFARDSSGLLSYAYSSGGSWSGWTEPNSLEMDIMDSIAAITRTDGTIEVFATGRDGIVQRFVQSGTSFAQSAYSVFPVYGAASSPTVTMNQDGRLQVFFREATGSQCPNADNDCYGRVETYWVTPSGSWTGPAVLYGDAGVGPIAAVRREGSGHIMLFERNTWNGISADWQVAPNSSFSTQWSSRGGVLEEYAAAATDGAGCEVVAVKGTAGTLWIQRESSSSAVGDFGAWILAGN